MWSYKTAMMGKRKEQSGCELNGELLYFHLILEHKNGTKTLGTM